MSLTGDYWKSKTIWIAEAEAQAEKQYREAIRDINRKYFYDTTVYIPPRINKLYKRVVKRDKQWYLKSGTWTYDTKIGWSQSSSTSKVFFTKNKLYNRILGI